MPKKCFKIPWLTWLSLIDHWNMAEILSHIIHSLKKKKNNIKKNKNVLTNYRVFKTCPYFAQKFGILVVTRARDVGKKVTRILLFVCFVDSFVGLFSLSVNTQQTATCTHPFMHVHMQFVSRGLEGKKGLIHYFLTLIGACKRIRRGRLSDGGARKYHLGGEPSGSVKWVDSYANKC